MKINDYNATLDEKMSEFDMWVTPSLGEIRDTPQFRINLEQLKKGFDYIADITENFADVSHCSSSALAANVLRYYLEKMMTFPKKYLIIYAMFFCWLLEKLIIT